MPLISPAADEVDVGFTGGGTNARHEREDQSPSRSAHSQGEPHPEASVDEVLSALKTAPLTLATGVAEAACEHVLLLQK